MRTFLIFNLLLISILTFGQEMSTETEEVFRKIEVQPEFKGGMAGFYTYIVKNMKYPDFARQNGIEGKVFVDLRISRTGEIIQDSVRIYKGVYESIDNEALRLVKESPAWEPGRYTPNGETVEVRMILPITFLLDKKAKKKKKKKNAL